MRLDKRQPTQLRAMNTLQGLLNNSDGSAKFSFNESNSVMVSVNGPMEVSIRNELLDKATIKVVWKPLIGQENISDKYNEQFIESVAEYLILTTMSPRSLLQITLQTIALDGSCICTGVNALTLCLLDAGVPMQNLASAVSCVINKDGELLLDPTTLEINDSVSYHCFVFSGEECVACDSVGTFTEEEYFECFDLCKLACDSIQQFIRTAVERKIEHTIEQK